MQYIVIPPSREEFEARMKKLFSRSWVKKIMRGWDLCGEIHDQERPRTDGSHYKDHPRACAWILIEAGVRDPRMILEALLHDTGEVKEGTPLTWQDVERIFKDTLLGQYHKAITKPLGQSPMKYTLQVFSGGVKLVIIKFGDRLHNVRTLEACDIHKQDRILADTLMFYNPDNEYYQNLLKNASAEDTRILRALWQAILEAIDELLDRRNKTKKPKR